MLRKMHRFVQSPLIHRALVTLFGFTIYLRTLAPTVMWYDMGEYQTAAYFLGVAHNTGYPLYLLLGKIFTFLPVGDPAFRVNVMSAFFGAGTLFLTHLLVFRLTDSKIAAFLTALTLSVTSTLWSNSTWAEVYTLNAFLSLLIIFLFVIWLEEDQNWQINLAVGVFGLSLGNHRLILAVGLGLGLVYLISRLHIQKSWSWREAFRLLGFFVLGFSIHLYLPIRSLQNPPVLWADASDPIIFFKMITTGFASNQAFLNPFGNLTSIRILFKMLIGFPVYEWTIPGLGVSLLGAFRNYKKKRVLFYVFLVVIILTSVMVSIYGIHDIFNYYHPIYLMIALWFGFGITGLLNFLEKRVSDWLSDELRFLTPGFRKGIVFVVLLTIPMTLFQRNIDRVDKHAHGNAKDYAYYLLDRVEPNAVIMVDFWSRWPLLYVQLVEGYRTDVRIVSKVDLTGVQSTEELAEGYLEDSEGVYIAQRDNDRLGPKFERLEKQLLAPYLIHSLPTDVIPAPKYKDLLIPRGAVYKILEGKRSQEYGTFLDQGLEIRIGDELVLDGAQIDKSTLKIGERYTIHYVWTLADKTAEDYWVDVLFTGPQGGVETIEGYPVWLQSHWIGGGTHPTSQWEPEKKEYEMYEGIVPRRVKPGTYQLRFLVYKDGPREGFVPAEGPGTIGGKIILQEIRVVP